MTTTFDDGDEMRYFFIVFTMILGISSASAQLFQKYQSREECINRELQKYTIANEVAFVAVNRFCGELFTKIESETIRKCGFNYDAAVNAGATHSQIVTLVRADKPNCLPL